MAYQKNPPTEEQQMRMKAAWETRKKQQEKLNRELSTRYNNWNCSICGKLSMAQVICRKAGGRICMNHCLECKHHSPQFWHCLYREPEKPWTEWATAESMKDLLQILTIKTRRTCIIGEMDDDCAYRIIDGTTGEIARGRVRFFDGAWHYGAFEKTK